MFSLVATVAVGGVAGAEARFGLHAALPHDSTQLPLATLLVNLSGCLLIGMLMVLVTELVDAHPLIRPLLGIGVLGGYTTFSTSPSTSSPSRTPGGGRSRSPISF